MAAVSASITLENACEEVCTRMETCLSTKPLECKRDGTCRRLFRSEEGKGFTRFKYHAGDALEGERPLLCSEAKNWATEHAGRPAAHIRPAFRQSKLTPPVSMDLLEKRALAMIAREHAKSPAGWESRVGVATVASAAALLAAASGALYAAANQA